MHGMADAYPSRVSGWPSITERKDPVVYGDATSGPLSGEALAAYKRQGFLFFRDFFSAPEIDSFNGELGQLWREYRDSPDPAVVREPESDEVRSIFAVEHRSRMMGRLARDRRVLDMARQILASDVYIHHSRINFKPGFAGKSFYWHSDFETWHCEDGMPRMRALTCVIALTENTPANGPMMLMPGSHRYFVQCVGETPEDHFRTSLRKQEIGTPDAESLTWLMERSAGIEVPTGPAGSLLLFDCNAIHGSNSNISPLPRSNVFFVFNSVENTLVEPFAAPKRRPGFMASRDFTPLLPHDEEEIAGPDAAT